jgi:hypothetical protein
MLIRRTPANGGGTQVRIENSVRFVKLDNTGAELSSNTLIWAQVLDRSTGLIWTAEGNDACLSWMDAKTSAAGVHVGGRDDWRLPTITELLSIVDYERFEPAVDTNFFRAQRSFYWTASPVAAAPVEFAWLIGFGSGNCLIDFQSYRAYARWVRFADRLHDGDVAIVGAKG